MVDFGEGPSFVLTIIPAEPRERAEVFGQLLFEVEAEAVFIRVAARPRDVQALSGRIERGAVAAHVGSVPVAEQTRHAAALADRIALFPFQNVAVGVAEVMVEL